MNIATRKQWTLIVRGCVYVQFILLRFPWGDYMALKDNWIQSVSEAVWFRFSNSRTNRFHKQFITMKWVLMLKALWVLKARNIKTGCYLLALLILSLGHHDEICLELGDFPSGRIVTHFVLLEVKLQSCQTFFFFFFFLQGSSRVRQKILKLSSNWCALPYTANIKVFTYIKLRK